MKYNLDIAKNNNHICFHHVEWPCRQPIDSQNDKAYFHLGVNEISYQLPMLERMGNLHIGKFSKKDLALIHEIFVFDPMRSATDKTLALKRNLSLLAINVLTKADLAVPNSNALNLFLVLSFLLFLGTGLSLSVVGMCQFMKGKNLRLAATLLVLGQVLTGTVLGLFLHFFAFPTVGLMPLIVSIGLGVGLGLGMATSFYAYDCYRIQKEASLVDAFKLEDYFQHDAGLSCQA